MNDAARFESALELLIEEVVDLPERLLFDAIALGVPAHEARTAVTEALWQIVDRMRLPLRECQWERHQIASRLTVALNKAEATYMRRVAEEREKRQRPAA